MSLEFEIMQRILRGTLPVPFPIINFNRIHFSFEFYCCYSHQLETDADSCSKASLWKAESQLPDGMFYYRRFDASTAMDDKYALTFKLKLTLCCRINSP